MSKDAILRYGNVKAAYPDKAMQIILMLGQAMQSGQVDVISDEMFKNILKKLTPQKREFKIRRV